jgi:hypothetical protein
LSVGGVFDSSRGQAARYGRVAAMSLELIFKHSGGVELRRVQKHGPKVNEVGDAIDKVVWASDADQDFMDEFGNEIMSADDDAEEVMDYLIETDKITEPQAEALEIYDESLDGTEIEPDDDDDGDEDEEFED